jgi:anti-sigma B factor antagonist
MPQVSVVSGSPAASSNAAQSPFVCTWKAGGLDAASVLLAGPLDLTTSPQLRLTVQDAQVHARVVVLDLRKLTFMDASGVHVILNAACGARRDGGRMMLVRGPAQVDEMLTLTAASDEVLIVDLDPTEPAKELLGLGRRTCDPPCPDSGPRDVADQVAARGDPHRFRSLLTHSPIARLFGNAYRSRPNMASISIAPEP